MVLFLRIKTAMRLQEPSTVSHGALRALCPHAPTTASHDAVKAVMCPSATLNANMQHLAESTSTRLRDSAHSVSSLAR